MPNSCLFLDTSPPSPAWLRGQEVSQTGALAPACLPAPARFGRTSGAFGSRGRLPRRLFSLSCFLPLSFPLPRSRGHEWKRSLPSLPARLRALICREDHGRRAGAGGRLCVLPCRKAQIATRVRKSRRGFARLRCAFKLSRHCAGKVRDAKPEQRPGGQKDSLCRGLALVGDLPANDEMGSDGETGRIQSVRHSTPR